jgi:N-acetyl-alpha-D-glucosaminyl L-malate synthase BshA
MKIGILCYPTWGGSGVVATELGKELALRGHQVHFISYSVPMRLKSFSENILFHKVEMASYPLFDFPLYSLALASKIVEVAKFSGLDLVHAHYAIPHATSAYLAREIMAQDHLSGKNDISSFKLITTLHGTDITLVGLETSFLPTMKFSIEKSDGVTAVSSFLKVKTQSQYDIHKDIEVIPNFVNLDTYKRISNDDTIYLKEALSKNGEKIIVHTSNFRPLKRVQDVIRIFNEIHKKIPCRLLLLGDGPDRSACYIFRQPGILRRDTFHRRSFPYAVAVRELRALRSGSYGVRCARSVVQRRGIARAEPAR